VTARKSTANRLNAQASTGPRTAAGKVAASLNARKHGLNTPVPDFMVQACEAQHRALLDFASTSSYSGDPSDLVYALAVHGRLRDRGAALMQTIILSTLSGYSAEEDVLRPALEQLRRLDTYERKSRSRLNRLLEGC